MAKVAVKRKTAAKVGDVGKEKRMAASEFKAKCLGVMSEIASTGKPILVTKRGEPLVEVIPPRNLRRKDDFFGRLKGVIEIVGDPDDLIRPVFPLEDYDMLK